MAGRLVFRHKGILVFIGSLFFIFNIFFIRMIKLTKFMEWAQELMLREYGIYGLPSDIKDTLDFEFAAKFIYFALVISAFFFALSKKYKLLLIPVISSFILIVLTALVVAGCNLDFKAPVVEISWLSILLIIIGNLFFILAIKIKEKKKCPYCAEAIKIEAKICRYCGKEILAESETEIKSSSIEEEYLTPVKVKNKWGYVNKKEGKLVINPQFDWADSFSEGLALVRIGGGTPNKYGLIVGGKYGYINKQGKFVIEPQFDVAYPFSGGLALVKLEEKWFYINKEGKIVKEW